MSNKQRTHWNLIYRLGVITWCLCISTVLSCAAERNFPTPSNPAVFERCAAKGAENLKAEDAQLHTFRAVLWSLVGLGWEIEKSDPDKGTVLARTCTREGKCSTMIAEAQPDGRLKLYCPDEVHKASPARRWSWYGHLKSRFKEQKCFTSDYLERELEIRGYPTDRKTNAAQAPKEEPGERPSLEPDAGAAEDAGAPPEDRPSAD